MDHRVERGEVMLSNVLRTGVLASAVLITLGLTMLFLTGHQTHLLDGGTPALISYPPATRPVPIESSLRDVALGLRSGDPDAVITLGLLLLIATPVMRVAASVALYAVERDVRYVAITLFVLSMLLLGLWLGKAE
jgi:uncharacterized membrane protein